MRRWTRRVLGLIVGFGLGWYVAGYLPMDTASFASQAEHGHGAADHASTKSHAGGVDHGHDQGTDAARTLTPTNTEIPWLIPVRNGIIALFVLAVVLGWSVLKLKAPDPPDPASEH